MVPGTMSLVPSSRLHFIKWSASYSFSNCCFAASFNFIISQEETDTGGHDTGIIILRTWTFPLCVAWYKMQDVASQAQYQLSSICGMSLKFFTNFTSIVMLEIIMKTSSWLGTGIHTAHTLHIHCPQSSALTWWSCNSRPEVPTWI